VYANYLYIEYGKIRNKVIKLLAKYYNAKYIKMMFIDVFKCV